jgi:hypothetical protein
LAKWFVGQMSVWPNVCLAKCPLVKFLSFKRLSANCPSAKCFSAKRDGTKPSFIDGLAEELLMAKKTEMEF